MAAFDPEILAALQDPATHGPDVREVTVIQTHASVVFLADNRVYKLKKPLDLGFLDYSTLARREAMCRAELALNRRLAPDVYLDVVPITRVGDRIAIDGSGTTIEWAVVMNRLPDPACWSAMLARHALGPAHATMVGERIARFHRDAPRSPSIAAWGSFAHVAESCRDNLTALRSSAVANHALVERLAEATERELAATRATIDARAAANVPCEFHGDLRLEHVYDLGGAARPEDLRIVDCIEFSEALRHGDPAADIAFLAMDLRMHGAWTLADALLCAWLDATADAQAAELLPLYGSYRSAVRAKVRAMQASDPQLDAAARDHAHALARGHLVLAWGELAPPSQRPALVLVAGLPGTGKSRLAADLETRADMTWIRADIVRKELAGIDPHASGHDAIEAGIYTHAWNDRTYGECLARAERVIEAGGRAIVDASFKEERRRSEFVAHAQSLGARVRILCCVASPDAIRTRLAERTHDPSDADWHIYEHAVRTWDPYGDATRPWVTDIDTQGPHDDTVEHALAQLRRDGLHRP